MVEKSDSNQSIGFATYESDESDEDNGPQIEPESNLLPYTDHIYNIAVFAIKCQHNKIPLLVIKDKTAVWLPFVKWRITGEPLFYAKKRMEAMLISGHKLTDKNHRYIAEKGLIQSLKLVSVSNLQLPNEEFISQHIFCAKWKTNSKTKTICCNNTDKFEWHSIADVINGKVNTIWGKEVLEIGSLLNRSDEEFKRSLVIGTKEVTMEFVYRYLSYDSKSNREEDRIIAESLKVTEMNRKAIEKLYSNFIQHCYPSLHMSFISLKKYLNKIGLKTIDDKFNDMSLNGFKCEINGFIDFHQFLLGFLALQSNTPQNMRNAYIFRYYDTNSDGFLDKKNIKKMFIDMKRFKDLKGVEEIQNENEEDEDTEEKDDEEDQDMQVGEKNSREVNRIMNIPGITIEENKITFETLFSKLDYRGLEAVPMLFSYLLITRQMIYRPIGNFSKDRTTVCMSTKGCPKHREREFKVAIHSLIIQRDGQLTDPIDIRNTAGVADLFKKGNHFNEMQRIHSINATNKFSSSPNLVRNVIRLLVSTLKTPDISPVSQNDLKTFFTSEKLDINMIEKICEEVKQIFRNESRVLKVQSPIFVFGDIHANIKDIIKYEELFWKRAPQCMATNVLFVGDYVEGGEFGVECVLYLFSMKILNPNQFFMLRGNYELRRTQKGSTFEKECTQKYKKDGQKVFETINQAFDYMPFAAVIDECLFCVHGGIPYSIKDIKQLNNVPAQIKDPEKECPAVWEILWSDPLNKEDYEKIIKAKKIKNDNGFIENTERGTAYYFSEKALNTFLTTNRLTHVIRAHHIKEPKAGFKLELNERVITISSSRYHGSKNRGALLHIHSHNSEGVIQVVDINMRKSSILPGYQV